MVSATDFENAGLPRTFLGMSWSSWKREDIRTILDLYEQTYRFRASKFELLRLLHRVTNRHALTVENRFQILHAKRDQLPLPAAKPAISAIAFIDTTTQASVAETTQTNNPVLQSPEVERLRVLAQNAKTSWRWARNRPGYGTAARARKQEYDTAFRTYRDARRQELGLSKTVNDHGLSTEARDSRSSDLEHAIMTEVQEQVAGEAELERIVQELLDEQPRPESGAEVEQEITADTTCVPATDTPIRGEEVNVPNPECIICFATLDNRNTPKRKITTSCTHEPTVCLTCLSRSIASQFADKSWDQISCPQCNEPLTYHDIKQFGDSVVFGKYVQSPLRQAPAYSRIDMTITHSRLALMVANSNAAESLDALRGNKLSRMTTVT